MNRFHLISLLTGAASVVAGFALIYHPLGFIIGGSLLIYAGVVGRKKNNA